METFIGSTLYSGIILTDANKCTVNVVEGEIVYLQYFSCLKLTTMLQLLVCAIYRKEENRNQMRSFSKSQLPFGIHAERAHQTNERPWPGDTHYNLVRRRSQQANGNRLDAVATAPWTYSGPLHVQAVATWTSRIHFPPSRTHWSRRGDGSHWRTYLGDRFGGTNWHVRHIFFSVPRFTVPGVNTRRKI